MKRAEAEGTRAYLSDHLPERLRTAFPVALFLHFDGPVLGLTRRGGQRRCSFSRAQPLSCPGLTPFCSMKKLVPLLLVGLPAALFACGGENRASAPQQPVAAARATTTDHRFPVNSAALQKDFATWWNYTFYQVHLSQDFVGLDVDSTVLKKAAFLRRLTSGHVVPFKTRVRNGVTHYRLYPVSASQPSIQATIQQMAANEGAHFKQEGRALPAYNFTDLMGKTYSPATTRGKVLVLKCWFIGCVACVKEFPEANKLVDRYQGRGDILFISLALDGKEKLVNFLKRNELKYATVPGMEGFIQSNLGIGAYPTHVLVDREGKIVKIVNRLDELKPFLAKQAGDAPLPASSTAAVTDPREQPLGR